jgi:hypothetical protein
MMMHQESTAQPCWKSHMREPWQCIFCVRHNHGNAFLRHSVRIYCRLRIPQFASLIYKAIGKKGGGNLEPWWERARVWVPDRRCLRRVLAILLIELNLSSCSG